MGETKAQSATRQAAAALLDAAARKASARRFAAEPVPLTGFGTLDEPDPAQQVADLIRDMRDPTHEQLQLMLCALANRVADMDRSGGYVGMDVLSDRIDAAYLALDGVRSADAPDEAELQADQRADMLERSR